MRDALVAELSAALGSSHHPLDRAAALLRVAFAVDRVSLARIDPLAGRFEIVGADGADLLAPGTALPVGTCSYFSTTSEGVEFCEPDFDRSPAFDRPLDGVVRAAGFRSGGSAPVLAGGRTVGAVSFSDSAPHPRMGDAVRDARFLGPGLSGILARGPREPRRSHVLVGPDDELVARGLARLAEDGPRLTPRERELLEALDEGLRFKQIAGRLGVSEATAKTHARNLFRKLDVTSRAEAVHVARRLGLLP